MRNEKCAIKPLFMAELTQFSRLLGNRGRGTRWWRQILDRKWKYGRFAHSQWKIRNITLIYGRIANMFASFRKSGSRNTMLTSDFSSGVEIRPFAHAQWKISNISLIYRRIAKVFACFKKSGSRNTRVTSDFRPEVEMRRFRACAAKKCNIALIFYCGRIAKIFAS